jgi:hypothetical protein
MAEEAISKALTDSVAAGGTVAGAINKALTDSVVTGGAVDGAIQKALTESVAAGGTVDGALSQALTASMAPGGSLAGMFKDECKDGGMLHTLAKGLVSQAIMDALKDDGSVTQAMQAASVRGQAEKDFPYMKHLKNMSVEQYRAAWRALLTDADNSEHLLASLQDQGVANILGLAAAHSGNADLQRMKQSALMKAAPKTPLKALCLPAKGGGPDKIQVFLGEKAESADKDVKALARSLLQLFYLVEKRYTVPQAAKKSSPTKAASQREELMPFFYYTVKAYKKRTTKATAASLSDNDVLLTFHGTDMLLGMTTLQALDRKRPATVMAPQPLPGATSSAGKGRLQSLAAPHAAPGAPDPKKQKVDTVKKDLLALLQKDPKDTAAINAFFEGTADKSALASTGICKNCALGGFGAREHNMKKCQEDGTPCALVCPKCKKKGLTEYHWLSTCSN